jgi:hypothetical protein
MTRRTLNILLIVFILAFVYTIMAYLDIMISLKYEIDNPTDCISRISEKNLCRLRTIYKGGIVITFLLIISTILLRIKTPRTK